jgi:aspartyl-tRNA synthetase
MIHVLKIQLYYINNLSQFVIKFVSHLKNKTMYRTHTCGELNISHLDNIVTLSGWIQKIRDKGGIIWIDLRDRYGITQLIFDESIDSPELISKARELGREYVISVTGTVIKRESANPNIPTGEIEIRATKIEILNQSETPPFTIENITDGGEELRMKYRFLDLRREVVRDALIMRSKLSKEIRNYLNDQNFTEIETPYLIKSTPEGARDFVVPSRLNEGEFYALPQSPQTFKQLLMVSGFDKYFQIVKCFRDEDFRADRQPEFTQIDCEMSFVEQNDILETFEGLISHLFKSILNVHLPLPFPQMPYDEAMNLYGSDKPDTRFDMKFVDISETVKGKGFVVFDSVEYIGAICAEGGGEYSRKQLDELTKFVQKPQIGAKGLVYVKCNSDGTYKSSVDKFYDQEALADWASQLNAKAGDLILVLAGEKNHTLNALCELRLEMGERLGLRDKNKFSPLWVVDFPLFEWDEEAKRYHAMHHPFTSPKVEDMEKFNGDGKEVRANAYDMVINGVELGGGSIRIHDKEIQEKMFSHLGFSKEEAEAQFGFLLNAFKYGAPPHGGIAFGFDRIAALFSGLDSIRDVIAFPKNNAGRDIMIDSPSKISKEQLDDLNLKLIK